MESPPALSRVNTKESAEHDEHRNNENAGRKLKNHLTEGIIPFWKGMRDDEFGGYYGYLDYDLNLDKRAEKGCILNSRITWFFSNAYTLLKDEKPA